MHRNWVGKRVCQSADKVRESVTAVVDSLWDNDADRVPTFEAVQSTVEHLKDLDAAVRDAEQIQQVVEDTSPVLQERRISSDACKQVILQLHADLDAHFPESGMNRKVRHVAMRRQLCRGGKQQQVLGPYTKQILTRLQVQDDRPQLAKRAAGSSSSSSSVNSMLVSTSEAGFSWELSGSKLVLKWTRVMCVTLKLDSVSMDVYSVQVTAEDGGGGDQWPSKFDVFRSVEREARRELRHLKLRSDLITQDEVNARFIAWLARYRGMFSRKCSLTKRHFALGGVGREGQLEARPPLMTKSDPSASMAASMGLDDDDRQYEAVFQKEMF